MDSEAKWNITGNKKEALPRDGTLWLASHRDCLLTIAECTPTCQVFVPVAHYCHSPPDRSVPHSCPLTHDVREESIISSIPTKVGIQPLNFHSPPPIILVAQASRPVRHCERERGNLDIAMSYCTFL